MRPRRLLARLANGSFKNVKFTDTQRLLSALGFEEKRTEGSHHIYVHSELEELLNLQDVKGEAKPYQLRQMLALVERYNLKLGDES
jgi:predicted RNA binding protein YcfA (HicA-like mRNA interferase family)